LPPYRVVHIFYDLAVFKFIYHIRIVDTYNHMCCRLPVSLVVAVIVSLSSPSFATLSPSISEYLIVVDGQHRQHKIIGHRHIRERAVRRKLPMGKCLMRFGALTKSRYLRPHTHGVFKYFNYVYIRKKDWRGGHIRYSHYSECRRESASTPIGCSFRLV
jgi:hypothetical protein